MHIASLVTPGWFHCLQVHFRVGGAIGTKIDPFNCPRGDGRNASAVECAGAWTLMHITKSATAYLENVWGGTFANRSNITLSKQTL